MGVSQSSFLNRGGGITYTLERRILVLSGLLDTVTVSLLVYQQREKKRQMLNVDGCDDGGIYFGCGWCGSLTWPC
jgi:hypothetical protein